MHAKGKSFDELWTNPMRGLDQMEVAVQGFRDQEGYPLASSLSCPACA